MPIHAVIEDSPGQRVPVKMWAKSEEVEAQAVQQLRNMASLPFVFKHVAAMPDVHLGKGAAVGSVIATKGAIIPAAVGVDIGCGMTAVATEIPIAQVQERAKDLRLRIEAMIPLGHHGNRELSKTVKRWAGWRSLDELSYIDRDLRQKAESQLGSLGGGNHFIEICGDTNQRTWLLLHSGSRHIGKALADRHIHSAKGVMKRLMINLPDPDLAYLLEGEPEFAAYIRDLEWCQSYARQNRLEMMDRLIGLFTAMFGAGGPLPLGLTVNCHHNYTVREVHFGEEVWLTRKGAVSARAGELGIIPGSMGARSFIVRGLGHAESFHSCSHGAGRRMSRNEAKRRFSVKDLEAQTQGVESRKDSGVIDEIPAAYKDIDEVMRNQSDLVEVVAELRQVICVKG